MSDDSSFTEDARKVIDDKLDKVGSSLEEIKEEIEKQLDAIKEALDETETLFEQAMDQIDSEIEELEPDIAEYKKIERALIDIPPDLALPFGMTSSEQVVWLVEQVKSQAKDKDTALRRAESETEKLNRVRAILRGGSDADERP